MRNHWRTHQFLANGLGVVLTTPGLMSLVPDVKLKRVCATDRIAACQEDCNLTGGKTETERQENVTNCQNGCVDKYCSYVPDSLARGSTIRNTTPPPLLPTTGPTYPTGFRQPVTRELTELSGWSPRRRTCR